MKVDEEDEVDNPVQKCLDWDSPFHHTLFANGRLFLLPFLVLDAHLALWYLQKQSEIIQARATVSVAQTRPPPHLFDKFL